jgi:MFS family permease
VDAPTALFAGFAYDKFKIRVLVLPFILSVVPTFFAMANSDLTMLVVAAAFFGLVLGMQESIYRAAVSGFSPISLRGTAYGIFNTAYGVGMLASGAVYGLMVELDIPYLAVIAYVLVTQAAAVVLLLNAHSKTPTRG